MSHSLPTPCVQCMLVAAALAMHPLLGCNSTSTSGEPVAPTPTILVPAENPESSPPPRGSISAPILSQQPIENRSTPVGGGKVMIGCGTFEPIMSQDACTVASDCGPATHCHARSCVGASKVPPKPADLQCTMDLVCKSLDVGRCDCVNGMCALVSKK